MGNIYFGWASKYFLDIKHVRKSNIKQQKKFKSSIERIKNVAVEKLK